MLPTPETRVWSSSSRLIPDVRRRTRRHEQRRRRTPGRTGRGRCARSPAAARRRPRRPTGRRTSAGRRSAAPRPVVGDVESEPDAQVALVGRARAPGRAAGRSSRGGRAGRRRCRAAARGTCRAAGPPSNRAAGQRGRRSRPGRARSRRTGRGCRTSTDAIGAADHVALEAVADDLDLGQLRHGASGQSAAGGRRRTPRETASAPYAVSAAACSASFFDRPTPLP